MFCLKCGVQANAGNFCPNCGAQLPAAPQGGVNNYNAAYNPARKNRLIYILLAIFLGMLGIHNFYAGYNGKGTAQLLLSVLSCGILSFVVVIWNIIEICTVEIDAKGIPMD